MHGSSFKLNWKVLSQSTLTTENVPEIKNFKMIKLLVIALLNVSLVIVLARYITDNLIAR